MRQLSRRTVAVVAAAVVLLLVVTGLVVRHVTLAGRDGQPTASGSLPAGPGLASGSPAVPSSTGTSSTGASTTGATAPGPSASSTASTSGSPSGALSLPVSAALPASTVVVPLKIDGQRDLYLVDTTGVTAKVQLPSPDGDDGSPAMPAGRGTILYVNEGQLRVMAADGTGDRLLLENPPEGCDQVQRVAWSWADPGLMVLQCAQQKRTVLVVARLDGHVVRRLSVARKVIDDISLSMDGSTLVYWASNDEDLDGGSLYSVRVDGSAKPVRLTKQPDGTDADPVWSPDGSQIAFRRRTDVGTAAGDQDVWVMNFDGSGAKSVVSTDASDSRPAWSRDGSQLLVASDRTTAVGGVGKTWDLWLVRVKDRRVLRSMGLDAQAVNVPYWWSR